MLKKVRKSFRNDKKCKKVPGVTQCYGTYIAYPLEQLAEDNLPRHLPNQHILTLLTNLPEHANTFSDMCKRVASLQELSHKFEPG